MFSYFDFNLARQQDSPCLSLPPGPICPASRGRWGVGGSAAAGDSFALCSSLSLFPPTDEFQARSVDDFGLILFDVFIFVFIGFIYVLCLLIFCIFM